MLKALLLCARCRRADVIGQAVNQIPEEEPDLILECDVDGVGYGIWICHHWPSAYSRMIFLGPDGGCQAGQDGAAAGRDRRLPGAEAHHNAEFDAFMKALEE
jgi:hypothetical protein